MKNNNNNNVKIYISYNDFMQFGVDSMVDIFYKKLSGNVKYSYLVKIGKDNVAL